VCGENRGGCGENLKFSGEKLKFAGEKKSIHINQAIKCKKIYLPTPNSAPHTVMSQVNTVLP
jgi:hypothetical protein